MKKLAFSMIVMLCVCALADNLQTVDVKQKSSAQEGEAAKVERQKEDKDNTFKWYDNLDEAMKESERLYRPIFALFTGSDWCPWCIKLEREILSKPEFQKYAAISPNPIIR